MTALPGAPVLSGAEARRTPQRPRGSAGELLGFRFSPATFRWERGSGRVGGGPTALANKSWMGRLASPRPLGLTLALKGAQRMSGQATGAVESVDRGLLRGEVRNWEDEVVEDQLARGLEGC